MPGRRLVLADEALVVNAHRELVDLGLVEPLANGGPDEAFWMDCELASFAENRLGDATDPRSLDEERRRDWQERALIEEMRLPAARSWDRCYWLLDAGERVGTVALEASSPGSRLVRVSSLYVLPAQRGRSLAGSALGRIRDVLGRRGRALGLCTSSTWQRAVRFYLRAGLWVRGWKRELDFRWDAADPQPVVEIAGSRASLSIVRDGWSVVLAEARRESDRLSSMDQPDGLAPDDEDLAWYAESTLAVAIALEGWPLIRSAEHWERARHSDFGPPESLAYKISIWEAWDREHGWLVETPRIPGLEYPSWREFEERWNRV